MDIQIWKLVLRCTLFHIDSVHYVDTVWQNQNSTGWEELQTPYVPWRRGTIQWIWLSVVVLLLCFLFN